MISYVNIIDLPGEIHEQVRRWRNHESVRRWQVNQRTITKGEHLKWIESLVRDRAKNKGYVFYDGRRPCGVVLFKDIEGWVCKDYGLYAVPGYEGSFYDVQREAFLMARDTLMLGKLKCFVFGGNALALVLHSSSGFKIVGNRDGFIYLEKDLWKQ